MLCTLTQGVNKIVLKKGQALKYATFCGTWYLSHKCTQTLLHQSADTEHMETNEDVFK